MLPPAHLHAVLTALLAALAQAAPALPQSNVSQSSGARAETEGGIRRKWISEIMSEELPHLTLGSSTNQECKRQALLYRSHLANLTLWAVQLKEATALSEYGLLYGNEYSNGHYDQCIRTHVPDYNIRGKYCHAHMKISPTYYDLSEPQDFLDYKRISPFSPAWAKIRRVNEQRIKYRDSFYWGVCIPSGCDRTDLEESLIALLAPAFNRSGIKTDITVDELACSVAEFGWNLSTGASVFLILICGLVLVVLIATIVHMACYSYFDEGKEDSSVILFFSAISNTNRLLKQDSRPEFKTISGMKVMSMILIIYGHRMLMSMYWPLFNVDEREKIFENFLEIININGSIIVNTFLFTTGFLVFNKVISDINKGRSINIPLYIFYRWTRIVPVYLFIICGLIFIKPLFPNEPLFKREGLWRVEACTENWWTHILFINNYYNASTECVLPAWYLAVDMQLYVVCIITGYIMSKSRKYGYIVLGVLLGASEIIPAVVIYLKGYEPILKLYINVLENYYKEEDFVDSYIPTHMRAAPYVIGMLTAVALEKLKNADHSFPKYQRIIGIFTCTAFMTGSLFYAWVFFDPSREPSRLENSMYVSIHRFAWSVSMAWITINGALHSHSKCTAILRRSAYAPFNKLMLNALLLHTIIQGETFLQQRQPEYINSFLILWKTAGDITATYILSYLIYLHLDGPLSRLQDLGMKKILKIKK